MPGGHPVPTPIGSQNLTVSSCEPLPKAGNVPQAAYTSMSTPPRRLQQLAHTEPHPSRRSPAASNSESPAGAPQCMPGSPRCSPGAWRTSQNSHAAGYPPCHVSVLFAYPDFRLLRVCKQDLAHVFVVYNLHFRLYRSITKLRFQRSPLRR